MKANLRSHNSKERNSSAASTNISKRANKKKIFSMVIALIMAITVFAPVTTSTASAAWKPSKTQLKNAQIIVDVLRDNGYTVAAACGILGNIQLESGMRPNISGGGYGLCQWTGGRAGSLKSRSGYYTARTQAKFIVQEMKAHRFGSWTLKDFKKSTSYSKTARLFCIYYERPGIKRMSTRISYAKAYYQLLKKPGKIKLRAYKGSFKVKMPKKNGYITGYQIAYKKAGTKKYKMVKTKRTYKRFYKKGSKKLYRVKVRTYTKIDGKTFYGEWSKVKKIRTKKIPKKKKPSKPTLYTPPAPTEEMTPDEAGAVICQIVTIDGNTLTVAVTSESGETVQHVFSDIPDGALDGYTVGDSVIVHFNGSLENGTHQYTAIYPWPEEEQQEIQ